MEPHQISFSVNLSSTTLLSLGDLPVLSPEYVHKAPLFDTTVGNVFGLFGLLLTSVALYNSETVN